MTESCVLGSSHDVSDGLKGKSGDQWQMAWEKMADGAGRIRDRCEIRYIDK